MGAHALNFSKILKQAIEITFSRRWLWLPSFLFALAVDVPRLLLAPFLPEPNQLNLSQLENLISRLGEITQNLPTVIGGIFLLSILLGGLWCVATIGQAVLIDGVIAIEKNRPIDRFAHWQKGRSLLGRFVAIDTLVLFPLFINLLLILLLLIGMSGSLLLTVRDGSPLQIPPLVGILGSLVFPLLCLIIPLAILAYLYRVIAFRLAVFDEITAWESIKQSRQFIRENLASVLLWLLLLGVVSYGINGLVLAFFGVVRFVTESQLSGVGGLLVELFAFVVSIVVATFRNLFVSVCWTLGMLELGTKKAPAE